MYSYNRVVPRRSYIRVFHAVPNAPAVDVYINNELKFRNLPYQGFTKYIPVLGGTYNIKVYPAGQKTTPVLNQNVNIAPEKIYTAAAIGTLPNLELLPMVEPQLPAIPGKSYVRFAHLSPKAPAVDITLPDGTVLFRNVGYKGVTDYLPLTAGTYTLQARVAGTNQVVLNVPNIRIKPNRYYTVDAIGIPGGKPPLQVVIPLDGNSYLEV